MTQPKTDLAYLRNEKAKAEQKLRSCQHRERILERQMSELNRRERVHRLCTRAGMLESFLVCPGELTDDQVMELLKISFRQPEVVLVGVAICGRPVARRLDDGYTLEVNRLCTDGTPNACSILYAAAYRAARAMGYNKVITYILDTENGSSLKAAGYTCEGRAGGLEWNGAKAPKRADQYPRQMKTRWVKKKEGLHGS